MGSMKLGIDAREAFKAETTGKGQWTACVIAELLKRNFPLTLFVEEGQECGDSPTPLLRFPKGIRWHFAVAKYMRKTKDIDLYLSPTSFIVPRIIGKKLPCAVVIHDLIAFHDEPHDRKAKYIERITLPKVLRTASHLFTVSEATKRELLERFPRTDREKITVVYEGPTVTKHEASFDTAQDRLRTKFETQKGTGSDFGFRISDFAPYILSISTLCPRKNQLRLIQAFNLLPENVRQKTKLILVGKRGWDDDEIVHLAKISPNVEWKGYVSDTEREKLLREAMVFAYPSLTEGFGLPVLDALVLGIPTLTSNRSSMPEVAGDGALLIDPKDVEEIAKGLERLLTDDALRKELQEKGRKQAENFSWGRTVDCLLEKVRQV